jgi:zinc transport system substrate-binding protein
MRTHRSIVVLSALAIAGLALPACSSSNDSSPEATSHDRVSVVASFYPLVFVAEHVAGDNATVDNLTHPGGEPHDLELTGRQVSQVADADLVLYLGGLQPSVDTAVEQNAKDKSLDAIKLADEVLQAPADEDEHGVEQEEGEDEDHDHGDGGIDPHIWLDPTTMEAITTAVGDRLAELDPANAESYRHNADTLVSQLRNLDRDFMTGLAQCDQHVIVVAHEAFGYLAKRYGLEQVGISGLDPEAEPSPERLAEVHDVVVDHGVTTIFYERLVSPDVATTLADDLGIKAAVLDPIEGLTDQNSDDDYLSLMRANLDTLRTANRCS